MATGLVCEGLFFVFFLLQIGIKQWIGKIFPSLLCTYLNRIDDHCVANNLQLSDLMAVKAELIFL